MTDKELFERNLELSTEFSRFIVAHPEVAKKIPRNGEVIFLLETDPELSRHNLKLAHKLRASGEQVVLVKIKGLRAVAESRLIEPHLEFAK